MVGETVITNNKAVNKDAPKSTARRLKKSGVSFCLKRFERSEALERLEQLERTDPVVNGAKRWNGWNDWNGLSVS
jgi:hypothetical protein